jgi:hypothetical protein
MLKRSKVYLTIYTIIIISIVGCLPMADKNIQLGREKYVSQMSPENYKMVRGKRILFSSIEDKSGNTHNLRYFNPERTVVYQLSYKAPGEGMAQPVVSFFWYALKKGFDQAGIIIEESSPIYDAQLTMTFRSVTDREINFDVIFTRLGGLIYEKNYSVRTPNRQIADKSILEQRAYSMIDSMVKTILDDPDFNKMFLK